MKSRFGFSNFCIHANDQIVQTLHCICFALAPNFSFKPSYVTCDPWIMSVNVFMRWTKIPLTKRTRFMNCNRMWCMSFVALS